MNNIFINGYELSQEQINIIKNNNKYTLIIAGAGTGKTTTLVGKIKYLLDNNLLSKDEICPITFTNNAVNNLEEAIYKNTNTLIPCYTFHKLAIKILKDNKINYNFISDKLLSYIIDEFYLSHAFNNKYLKRIILNRYHYLLDIPSNYNKIFNSPSYLKDKELITTFINLASSNNINDYEHYIQVLEKNNVPNARENVKQMFILDYLIMNIDRHMKNFGVIRDVNTLKWISTTPIFDNGESMQCYKLTNEMNFVNGNGKFFSNTNKDYEEILKSIGNISNVDFSKLNGIVEEYRKVLEEYQTYTDSTQERINKLCEGLEIRIKKIQKNQD